MNVPIIPPFAIEAVIGYVVERTFFTMMSKDKAKYTSLWAGAKDDLYGAKSRTEASTWDEAKHLLRKMDQKTRDDFYDYMSKLNY